MDPLVFASLDLLAAVFFALSFIYLIKAERYEDPGALPIILLVVFGTGFLVLYTLFDFMGYAHLVNPLIVNSWKDVALPLAAICFFISALMTKQLSDLVS